MDTSPLTPASLDAYADAYYLNAEIDDIDIEELAQRQSIPAIVAGLAGCSRVLEMGFGTGLITRELIAAGVSVEVLEGSPRLAAHARSAHPGLIVHVGMFETFQPADPFDAVLALHVLEHVDDPVALLVHLRSWLRSGGMLTVVTPNAESLHRQLAVRMGLHENLDDLSPRDHVVGHQRVYNLQSLHADLTAGGFTPEEDFGYFVKPLSNAQMLDWPMDVLRGLNQLSDVVPPRLL
ncbi:MAG TPA: class I SAM-dependent methyltransferase, partial [Nocardioides sp.]